MGFARISKQLLAFVTIGVMAAKGAAVTAGVSTTSTSNVTSYASGSFTPAANDLLVAFVFATATVAAGSMTDSQSLGFTKVGTGTGGSSLDTLYCFVANKLAANSAMTVTFDCTGDAATGTVIFVARISGMNRTQGAAVRQFAHQDNQGSSIPNPAFNASVLTGNPTLGLVSSSNANPPTITPPTSWTEQVDTGFASPTAGAEWVSRDSGFTGTQITWGGATTAAASIIIELNSLDVAVGKYAGFMSLTK